MNAPMQFFLTNVLRPCQADLAAWFYLWQTVPDYSQSAVSSVHAEENAVRWSISIVKGGDTIVTRSLAEVVVGC